MKEGIFKVTDPSSLRTIKGNRAIKMPHVARIMSSMKTKPMLKDFPILLTKNNEVLDGQHRLQAAIKLGIPIYAKYAEEMTKKEIPAINSISMKWSKIEYLNMYCDFGLLPYQKLSAFFDYAKSLNIGFGVVGAIFMKTKQTTTGVYQCGMLEKKTFCVNNWAVFECGGFEYPEDDSFAYGYIDFIKESFFHFIK